MNSLLFVSYLILSGSASIAFCAPPSKDNGTNGNYTLAEEGGICSEVGMETVESLDECRTATKFMQSLYPDVPSNVIEMKVKSWPIGCLAFLAERNSEEKYHKDSAIYFNNPASGSFPGTAGRQVCKSSSGKKHKDESFEHSCFEQDIDYSGNDINADETDADFAAGAGQRESANRCQKLCQQRNDCEYFTYDTSYRNCWLKSSMKGRKPARNWHKDGIVISGKKYCDENKCPWWKRSYCYIADLISKGEDCRPCRDVYFHNEEDEEKEDEEVEDKEEEEEGKEDEEEWEDEEEEEYEEEECFEESSQSPLIHYRIPCVL